MAADSTNELLMMLVADSGPLAAECRTEVDLDQDKEMLRGFTNGKFFQVDEFTFSMSVEDEDATSDAANASGGKGVGAAGQNKGAGPQEPFQKWKSASVSDTSAMSFPLNVDEFSFTRVYDCASPVLFDKCSKSEGFTSAALVKRKVVGDNRLQSFLRFDFEDVLITSIQWQDGEVIKETVKMLFCKLKVHYKTQSASGKLGATRTADLTPGVGLATSNG